MIDENWGFRRPNDPTKMQIHRGSSSVARQHPLHDPPPPLTLPLAPSRSLTVSSDPSTTFDRVRSLSPWVNSVLPLPGSLLYLSSGVTAGVGPLSSKCRLGDGEIARNDSKVGPEKSKWQEGSTINFHRYRKPCSFASSHFAQSEDCARDCARAPACTHAWP